MELKKVFLAIIIIVLTVSFSAGIAHSQITDKDGNSYNTATIGTKEWTTENLNVEHYRNGDVIPQVQDAAEWKKLTTGAWCYYENLTENGKTYGKLYNWYAVTDSRGLVPEGWHVPSDEEFTDMTNSLGGNETAGGKLKAVTLWNEPNKGATNESGYSALPGGYRADNGSFKLLLKYGCFWTSTQTTTVGARCRELHNNITDIIRDTYNKKCGLHVRCVKD
ncbi:MAG: fibrobacter succinogenes major paralogous domain-containing protein [Ignavibacteria bacterium]